MKDFRVIGITESHIKASDQRVLIFDLAEIELSDYTLPSGGKSYNFELSGEKYVVKFNSKLSNEISNSAHNEDIVSLDLSEFITQKEKKEGKTEKVYYHSSVNLSENRLNNKFKILEMSEAIINETNQKVMVFDLAEACYKFGDRDKNPIYGNVGEKHIFELNSYLSNKLTQCYNNNEIASLNINDFIIENHKFNGIIEKIHFHKTLELNENNGSSNYKSTDLSGKQLAMLFNGFVKGHFERPKNEEILYKSIGNGACKLFFQKKYLYIRLIAIRCDVSYY